MSTTPKTRVESVLQFVSPGRRGFFRAMLSAAAVGAVALVPASELLAQNQAQNQPGGGKGKGNGGAKGKGKGNGNGAGNAAGGAAKGKGDCQGKGKGKGDNGT